MSNDYWDSLQGSSIKPNDYTEAVYKVPLFERPRRVYRTYGLCGCCWLCASYKTIKLGSSMVTVFLWQGIGLDCGNLQDRDIRFHTGH